MQRITRPVLGWVFYDFANSAFATAILAVIFNRYFAQVIAGGETGTQFNMPWGQMTVPGSALWSFLVAASTAIVAVSSPLLGAIADQAMWRKKLLIVYCYVGVAATIGLSTVGSGDLFSASLLFMVANLGFSGGNVFYNSFLKDISREDSYGRISGLAWGAGYLGGGLCLVINLIMLQNPELLGFEKDFFSVGDCILVAGIWWGVFTIPTMLWVHENQNPQHERLSVSTLVRKGWNRITVTFREIRQYKQLVRFLIAYLLFNDGVETVIIMASIFGAIVVGMTPGELVGYFIMIQGTAMLGSLFFGWLSDRIGNKNTLLITLFVWLSIVIWAYKIGWLLDVKSDFYILGVLAGLVMGGSQSSARSMQALFTPPEKSAEFFGFFAISGRFASIFGSAIYGAAIVIGGNVQSGILSLGIFFLLGGIILIFVDEKHGITP